MTYDFRAARLTMVEGQVRTSDVTDAALVDAMRVVPRERLCPPAKAQLAYADAEIEYAPGLWLMRPREIGKLLQVTVPQPLERALAIAAPYAALVLQAMGLDVHQVEAGEGSAADGGPFDVVITEGAVTEVPAAWLATLAEGGRLAAVVRRGPVGKAWLYTRAGGHVGARDAFDATPPYLPGFSPKPHFAF